MTFSAVCDQCGEIRVFPESTDVESEDGLICILCKTQNRIDAKIGRIVRESSEGFSITHVGKLETNEVDGYNFAWRIVAWNAIGEPVVLLGDDLGKLINDLEARLVA